MREIFNQLTYLFILGYCKYAVVITIKKKSCAISNRFFDFQYPNLMFYLFSKTNQS